MDKLENIGYGDWFRNQVDVGKIAAHEVARVVAVHKNTLPVFPDVKLGRELLPFDQ